MLRTVLLVPFSLLLACGGGGGSDSPSQPGIQAILYTPCAMAAQAGGVDTLARLPASRLAKQLIEHAAQIGGVSPPAGGSFLIRGYENAYYDRGDDHIAYGPEWLSELNDMAGHKREAGDSVLFHEVGHMWAYKRGHMARIGFGTVAQAHRQELQADSFAGYVLSRLNGDVGPSLSTYVNVFSDWSPTHPSGALRAQVFFNAWDNEEISLFAPGKGSASALPEGLNPDEPSREAAFRALKVLQEIRTELRRLGHDPYSASSDEAFSRLKNERKDTTVSD